MPENHYAVAPCGSTRINNTLPNNKCPVVDMKMVYIHTYIHRYIYIYAR